MAVRLLDREILVAKKRTMMLIGPIGWLVSLGFGVTREFSYSLFRHLGEYRIRGLQWNPRYTQPGSALLQRWSKPLTQRYVPAPKTSVGNLVQATQTIVP